MQKHTTHFLFGCQAGYWRENGKNRLLSVSHSVLLHTVSVVYTLDHLWDISTSNQVKAAALWSKIQLLMIFLVQERKVQPNWSGTTVTKDFVSELFRFKMFKKKCRSSWELKMVLGKHYLARWTNGRSRQNRARSFFLPAKREIFLLLLLVGGVNGKVVRMLENPL